MHPIIGLLSQPFSLTHLPLQVGPVLGLILAHSIPVSPLGVSVNVHLHDTIVDRLADLSAAGATAAMEDEEDGLVLGGAGLGLDVLLAIAKDLEGGGSQGARQSNARLGNKEMGLEALRKQKPVA